MHRAEYCGCMSSGNHVIHMPHGLSASSIVRVYCACVNIDTGQGIDIPCKACS